MESNFVVTYVPIPQEMLASYSFSAIVEITEIEEKQEIQRIPEKGGLDVCSTRKNPVFSRNQYVWAPV